eukprot:793965-Amphidinium_carterae.1
MLLPGMIVMSRSFEEAASMPVIFVTVEVISLALHLFTLNQLYVPIGKIADQQRCTMQEALGDVAKLTKGERVLIHAAAGGVGPHFCGRVHES